MHHSRFLTPNLRELWSRSMFMLSAQFIDRQLVDSLGHVRPRLSSNALSDYWRVHVDYPNQWPEARFFTINRQIKY